jgi:hypothetical protein
MQNEKCKVVDLTPLIHSPHCGGVNRNFKFCSLNFESNLLSMGLFNRRI